MSCNENTSGCGGGCGGTGTTYKLLSKEGLQHIVEVLSGKLFTVWGSLGVSATAPLHLEKSIGAGGETIVEGYIDVATEESDGLMSAEDKSKLDALQSYDVATEESDGLMSAEDKTKLDALQSYDVATEESDGLMSAEDKSKLDTLSSVVSLVVSRPVVVFSGTSLAETLTVTAMCGGAIVPIDEVSAIAIMGSGFSVSSSLADGVLTITVRRGASFAAAVGTLVANVAIGDGIYRAEMSVYSADPTATVLQGYVNPVYGSSQLSANLWTFDGSAPTVRFVRDGVFWVNLPSSWASYFGSLDVERLNVHVTMAGEDVGTQVFCGRYAPGQSYNADTASTDCWAAVLVIMEDTERVQVNDPFFITVSYVPFATTYYAEKETSGGGVTTYATPAASLVYGVVANGGGVSYATYSYSQAWAIDGVSQPPITTGAALSFALVETLASDYYDVEVDATTGAVTATTKGYMIHNTDIDLCTVAMTCTMNGLECTTTATVVAAGTAGGVVGDNTLYETPVVSLSYPIMENGGSPCYPALAYSQSWWQDGVLQPPITTGAAVVYTLVENLAPTYYTIVVDSVTGLITATEVQHEDNEENIPLCVVRADVTLNGLTGSTTYTVSMYGAEGVPN